MAHHLDTVLHFQLRSPIHITGERGQLWTDKALLLDWRGEHAVIPATSIKGWLRESVERILRGMNCSVCDGSRANRLCGQCLVCQLFGHPRQRAKLRFADVCLADDLRDIRTNVSLSRYRRTSYEERLFSTELAWQSAFTCLIQGTFTDPQQAQLAAALLYLGSKTAFALGASRSRGLGWVSLTNYEAHLDGQPLSIPDLVLRLQTLTSQQPGATA